MPLRLVNTTPGDVVEPLLPGRPVVFSVKSETGHVSVESLAASMGSTNCAHRVVDGLASLPEANAPLLTNARVDLRSPEHLQPVSGDLPRSVNGAEMLMGPGPSSGLQNSVYEISSDVGTYHPVLASVTFKVRAVVEQESLLLVRQRCVGSGVPGLRVQHPQHRPLRLLAR